MFVYLCLYSTDNPILGQFCNREDDILIESYREKIDDETFKKYIKSWWLFLTLNKDEHSELTPANFLHFGALRIKRKYRGKTILWDTVENDFTGLKYILRLQGRTFDWGPYKSLRDAMKDKYGKKGSNKRKPFSISHIKNYNLSLDVNCMNLWQCDYDCLLNSLICELYYFTMMRSGEGVNSFRNGVLRGLMVCDAKYVPSITIVEEGVDVIHDELKHWVFRIEKHKTSRKVGDKVMIVGNSTDDCINPLLKLRVYLARRKMRFGLNSFEKLFVYSNNRVASLYHLRKIVKKIVYVNKLKIKYYSTHSFRIGYCTELGCRNVPIAIIAKVGCWKIPGYHTLNCYLRPSEYDLIGLINKVLSTPRKIYDTYYVK